MRVRLQFNCDNKKVRPFCPVFLKICFQSRCPWQEIACCHMFEKDTGPEGHMSPAGNPSCPEVSQPVDLLNHR